ncbi:hypothetical protein KC19_11G022700 [Ceratodon purpureus]|uniref:Uncharacterized protein n=1 Tax=Ceratodon purpureus TaxID=3225 RepID=A0A8T0GAA9_CERPU|nr:hypothetical protein KC19_11G022700 [Ceratodon purpureus]
MTPLDQGIIYEVVALAQALMRIGGLCPMGKLGVSIFVSLEVVAEVTSTVRGPCFRLWSSIARSALHQLLTYLLILCTGLANFGFMYY